MNKFSKYQELQIKEAINREGYYGSIAYQLFSQDVLKINDKDEYFHIASAILSDFRYILNFNNDIAEYILKRYFQDYYGSKDESKKNLFLDYMKTSLKDFYSKYGTSIEEKDNSSIFGGLSSYFTDIKNLSDEDFNTYFKKSKKFEEIYEASYNFLKRIRNLDYIDYLDFYETKFQLEINYNRLFNIISSIKKYNLNIVSLKYAINYILITSLNSITNQHQVIAKKFLQRFYIGLPILFITLAYLTTLLTSATLCLLVIMFFFYPLGTYFKYLQIETIYIKNEALFSTTINYAEAMTQKNILIPVTLKNVCNHLKKLDDSIEYVQYL